MSLATRIDKLERNLIINPFFNINQRRDLSTEKTIANSVFATDRFKTSTNDGAGMKHQILTSGGPSFLPNRSFLRCKMSTTGSFSGGIRQPIANHQYYAGKKMVAWAVIRTQYPNFRLGLFDGSTFQLSDEIPSDNTWRLVPFKVQVGLTPSQLNLYGRFMDASGGSVSVNANDFADITFMGLSEVDVDNFDGGYIRSDDEELALCMRYYEQSYDFGVEAGTVTLKGAIVAISQNYGSNYSPIDSFSFAAVKRVVPTIQLYDPVTASTSNFTSALTGYTQTIYQAPNRRGFAVAGANYAAITDYWRLHFTASAELA